MCLGYERKDNFHTPFSQGTCPSALGLPKELDTIVQNCEFPQISFAGNTNVSGPNNSPALGQASFTSLKFTPYTYTAHADITKVLNKPTLKAGYEFRKLLINFRQLGSPDGQYAFGAGYTQRVVNAGAVATEGNGFATFLLGLPNNNGGVPQFTFDAAISSAYHRIYAEDEWKVARQLHLNLGLPWEAAVPRTHQYVRLSY